MKTFPVWIRKNMSTLLHPRLRSFILQRMSLLDSRTDWWRQKDPYRDDPPYSTYKSQYPVKLGIIKEFWYRHSPYIAACRELGVSYEIIDILGPDWISKVNESKCDAFLVYPSVQLSIWKNLYDERLKIITEDLGKTIFPSYNELWMYESKRRMAYWLEANSIPHAKTWIFYDKSQALEFANTTCLPIVAKTNMGARASGVQIFRDRKKLVKYVKSVFKKGIVHADGDSRDLDWGNIVLQEYIRDIAEWRILRLGNSYFGHQKLKRGAFHSGSDLVGWYDPPEQLLDFVRRLTDIGDFKSMCVDIFQSEDRPYVNELQAFFGWTRPYQMLVNGRAGRYIYTDGGESIFEEGIFCQNGGCNLRVVWLLSKMGLSIEMPSVEGEGIVSEDDRLQSIDVYED